MDFIVLIILIIITMYAFITTGWRDTENTIDSRNNAIDNNYLCYQQYNNKKRITRLTSNDQRVHIYNRSVIDKKGNKMFDIDELELQRREEYVKDYCRNKGYDFYPVVEKEKVLTKPMVRPVYRSFFNNETFVLSGKKGNWDKYMVENKNGIWSHIESEKYKNKKSGERIGFDESIIIVRNAYDFHHNINEELKKVLCQSKDLFEIKTGVR